MTTEERIFDGAKAEAFAGQMLGIVNHAMLALGISVAQQSGLLDGLAGLAPSTSDEVARALDLNERYTRECLAVMVTGGIVDYDPATQRYSLPPEHAAFVTTAAGPDNIGYFSQYVPLFAAVEGRIVSCMKDGGGVPYAEFARFQELQGGETRAIYDATLLQRTVPSIPGLAEQLERGIAVADIGCGQGHALNVLAAAYPRSTFTGYDFSEDGLRAARAEMAASGVTNLSFVAQDVARLDATGAYDLILAFDSIHDQVAPRTVLRNIRRALRPGGTFLMVDIAASSKLENNLEHPLGSAFYAVSLMHCMTVSLAHGGEGLGTMWGEEQARELLAEAGFGDVESRQIEGDMLNVYFICR
jgi:ubiquinone/menaquinone biosynthesis C-methylase UbiE